MKGKIRVIGWTTRILSAVCGLLTGYTITDNLALGVAFIALAVGIIALGGLLQTLYGLNS